MAMQRVNRCQEEFRRHDSDWVSGGETKKKVGDVEGCGSVSQSGGSSISAARYGSQDKEDQ